jgi:uncharacterized membrane protein
MWVLRTGMLLALVVWVGGIIFFAFVLAPTLFSVLPSPQMAGSVVSPALTKLHWMGLIAGGVFLACSLTSDWLRFARFKPLTAAIVLVVPMLVLTAISQFGITPRMRELRTGLASPSARDEFDRLHSWSTRLEGGVLILGLGLVVLIGRRWGTDSR